LERETTWARKGLKEIVCFLVKRKIQGILGRKKEIAERKIQTQKKGILKELDEKERGFEVSWSGTA